MNRHIAFLRAINVGGHIVKMDALRRCFEALDFDDVATFIASGNVIFTTKSTDGAKLEQRIEKHLRKSLGYDVDTFLRSPAELDAIARYAPFDDAAINADGARLYVGFLRASPDAAAVRRVESLQSAVDALRVHDRQVYWLSRVAMSDSPVSGARIEKALAASMTMRNVTTVRRLAAKYPPAA